MDSHVVGTRSDEKCVDVFAGKLQVGILYEKLSSPIC
jgi:hypothetical protein